MVRLSWLLSKDPDIFSTGTLIAWKITRGRKRLSFTGLIHFTKVFGHYENLTSS